MLVRNFDIANSQGSFPSAPDYKYKELIDELIATSGGSLIGPDGLVKELTKALVERMLSGELSHHLGYGKHEVGMIWRIHHPLKAGFHGDPVAGGGFELRIERRRRGWFTDPGPQRLAHLAEGAGLGWKPLR